MRKLQKTLFCICRKTEFLLNNSRSSQSYLSTSEKRSFVRRAIFLPVKNVWLTWGDGTHSKDSTSSLGPLRAALTRRQLREQLCLSIAREITSSIAGVGDSVRIIGRESSRNKYFWHCTLPPEHELKFLPCRLTRTSRKFWIKQRMLRVSHRVDSQTQRHLKRLSDSIARSVFLLYAPF